LGARVEQKLWAEDAQYRQILQDNFELLTLCLFNVNEPAESLVAFSHELCDLGFSVHAHRLFCKRDTRLLKATASGRKDAIAQLIALVRQRVTELAHCESLDIFNEIVYENWLVPQMPWLAIIDSDWLRIVLETAREAAPSLKLYWNEYALKNSAYWDSLYDLCAPLAADGLLDGVGIQIHSRLTRWWKEGQTLLGPDFYPSFSRAKFDRQATRFQALGLSVRVSECSVMVQPGQPFSQGKLYQNYFDYAQQTKADAFVLWFPMDEDSGGEDYAARLEERGGAGGWWGWQEGGHVLKPWASEILTRARRQCGDHY
jgi:GH35 family endo-1,4-beta-xylanase